VPTQPQQDPAPPAPAVDSSPEAPTETYKARTSNAGQRRRQQHKAQRAATKQASKQNKKNESTTSCPTTRSVSNPSKPKKRNGTKITSHTVNHVSSVFAKPPPSHPTPTPEPITHSSLPAHAFWTANAVVDLSTGTAMEYPQLKLGEDSKLWLAAASREIGRLGQGKQPDMPIGSNTMHFLDHRGLPAGHKATYLRIVAAIKMHKVETHRIRFTVGGNRINYKGKVSTPTANLETIKILLNSTVSTPNAKMLTANIESFYLGTPMDCYEYMRIPAKDIPADIMEQYKLAPLVHKGHVLTEIRKGMYGLPQAGILAYNRLVQHLALSDYTPVKHTHGLFRHATRPVTFSLMVDDFAIKYVNGVNAEHLLATLRSLYNITTDWTASMYCGITLQWHYVARTVDLSMPGYIEKALETYLDKRPKRPQHAPHAWTAPSYSSKVQLTPPADDSEFLDAGGLTRIQQIIGTLLFYGRAINSTLLVALGTLSAA
jgi:hypothetical protein